MGKRAKLTSRALEIAKNRNSSLCFGFGFVFDFNFINILAATRYNFRLAQNKRPETDLSVRLADRETDLCAQQVRGKKMYQKHAKQEPKHRPHDTRRNMIIFKLGGRDTATLAHCNEPRWRARLDLSVLIALFQWFTNRQLVNCSSVPV